MPYEVCYRALLSISVVEGWKPHTTLRPAAVRRRAAASATPYSGPRSPHAGLDHNVSVFRFHPQDSLAGGPPARWFVILYAHCCTCSLGAAWLPVACGISGCGVSLAVGREYALAASPERRARDRADRTRSRACNTTHTQRAPCRVCVARVSGVSGVSCVCLCSFW